MYSLNKKNMGNKLAQLRGNKPQRLVAKDLGISESALSMYEQGERIPRDEIKIKIAQYYQVSIQSLFYTS